MYWCSVTTKIAFLVTIGLILSLTGLMSYLFLPYIVEYNVKQQLVLSPTSMTFDGWQRPSIAIYTKFYIFNVTNSDAFLNKQQKPILQELGPYTFRETHEKVNISWDHMNGTVSYKTIRRWHYVAEETNGSLDDEVVHLNVPMISAANKVSKSVDQSFISEALNVIIEESQSLIFKRNTVRQLLFDGYEEVLLEAAKDFFPETPFTRFGWYYMRNNTSTDGIYRIFTGEKGINRLGLMDSWNNHKINNKWFGSQCEKIEGISGGDFQPPYRLHPKPKNIDFFAGDMCRPITLDFTEEVDYNNIKCDRYMATSALFNYNLPENQCYCHTSSCPANGVLNVSVCTQGSPTAISYPHFLYADNIYLQSIDGLSPNLSSHGFNMDYENTLGIPLNIAIRLQINTVIERNDQMDFAKNFSNNPLYFPQFWFSTTAQVNDEMVEQLNFLVNLVPHYINIISILLLITGFLTLTISAVFTYRSKRNLHISQRQKYKAVEMISTSSK
ncbi:protein croquemort-like [Oppia nitens]|uniref:protein croquemort-like n=1 Tax=Oppia nitens TaxID=1686743 RepID=UPI0023DC86D1|nr:protein croquemort-like [Oppia nitens]